jgi:LuxR family maltose regulon positive regulatory protein
VPLDSKVHAPQWRQELVPRPHLVERLRSARDSPLILVTGPAGYGKTTLVSEWGREDERPFVWLTLDASDNDASRMLTYIVFALADVMPLGAGIFPRPPEPGPSFTAFALPRLTRALAARVRPFVLAIDDVHVLHDQASLDLLAILVQNVPEGSHVVMAGRDVPPLPISRLLVNHALVGIGAHHLAMGPNEGLEMLHAAGVPVGASEAKLIVDRTEGWAAGLAMAAMALREQEHLGRALEAFAGSDGLVTDYLRDEVLEGLTPELLEFMLGTAILDRLSAPLCDAVLGTTGSGEKLEWSSRAHLFVSAVDRDRIWFRRHQLFSEMLVAELRRRAPDQEPIQHRRAAEWFEASGDPDAALDHAEAAGDVALAAQIISRNLVPYLSTGRASTVRRWIERLPVDQVSSIPWFAAAAAMAYVSTEGGAERASYWLGLAESANQEPGPLPDGRRSLRSALAITRAVLGIGGMEGLRRDAEEAYGLEVEGSPWRSLCALLVGTALELEGDLDAAEVKLREAADLSALELPSVHAWALAELSVCAFWRGDWEAVRELAERARVEVELHGLQDYASASVVYAASSVSCAYWRQPAEARRDAMRAARLLSSLSRMMPWKGVEGRVLIAHAYLRLGDVGAAHEALREASRELSRHRLQDAPGLRAQLAAAREAMASAVQTSMGPALTSAEIRVVQFLPTHLSFREIAERLHVSRNTVKTQVISAYRKLGAANRTEAVEAARALAILDP